MSITFFTGLRIVEGLVLETRKSPDLNLDKYDYIDDIGQ